MSMPMNWLRAYAAVWNYLLKIPTSYGPCHGRRLLWIWISLLARASTCTATLRMYSSCECLFASRFICVVVNSQRGKDVFILLGLSMPTNRLYSLQFLSISLLLSSTWSTFICTSSEIICKTAWHVLPKETSADPIPKYICNLRISKWSSFFKLWGRNTDITTKTKKKIPFLALSSIFLPIQRGTYRIARQVNGLTTPTSNVFWEMSRTLLMETFRITIGHMAALSWAAYADLSARESCWGV